MCIFVVFSRESQKANKIVVRHNSRNIEELRYSILWFCQKRTEYIVYLVYMHVFTDSNKETRNVIFSLLCGIHQRVFSLIFIILRQLSHQRSTPAIAGAFTTIQPTDRIKTQKTGLRITQMTIMSGHRNQAKRSL